VQLVFNSTLGGWLINPLKSVFVSEPSNTWMVVLDPMKPGGPFEVMAQQTLGTMNFTLRVHDVLFGDVWLCSGQSNMQMTVSQVMEHLS
jgi:sialate O-acetylesterase